jgi:hypothetical protein
MLLKLQYFRIFDTNKNLFRKLLVKNILLTKQL